MSQDLVIHDLESERAILGSILSKNECIENVMEILHSSDFYGENYRKIFVLMEKMYASNEIIEPLSLSKRIEDEFAGEISNLGDKLSEIKDKSPNPDNVEFYAQRVVNDSAKRQAIDILSETSKEIQDTDDPLGKMAEAVGRMENVRSVSVDKTVFSIQDLFKIRTDYLEKKQRGEINEEVLSTGLKDLDELLNGGLRFRHFDVLAARPAMGKTSLAVQIALNAGLREGFKTLIFSIEMSKEDIMDKMTSIESKVPYRKINQGDLGQDEWDKITQFAMNISPKGETDPQVLIDDVTKDLNRMIAVIRRCVRKHGVKFVVIDYLQLMNIPGKFNTRDEQLGQAVNTLAFTAKTLNINVLALSQLNRGVESRENRRPHMSDLRESGNIEQAAWRVLSIYREDYYNSESDQVGVAEIAVLKGKISNTGKVQVHFDKECTRFNNLAWQHSEM